MASTSATPAVSSLIKEYGTKLGIDVATLNTEAGSIQQPAETIDGDHPLSHYYISSSHNTYLWGHQLYGKASATPYQQVLERGCRCVEIDVWDGEHDSSSDSSSDEEAIKRRSARASDRVSKWRPDRVEPRVLHGYTATKEVSFRDVVETIGLYAFTKSDLPLIVSLEVHTSHSQQEIMVEIMREYWSQYLVEDIEADNTTALPTVNELRNKILIKVKYSAPKAAASPTLSTKSAHSANSIEAGSDDESQSTSVTTGKIIPALGRMGIYTRSHRFTHFDQPEASYPTHIFSMSEAKLSSVHAKEPKRLFRHNKTFLLRAYPRGTRVSSSNLDPAVFWRLGVQIVALNWQHANEGTMLNHAMFDGTGGYVLKPHGYRDEAAPLATMRRGTLDLTIDVFAGMNLGPRDKKLRAYVKCELHVEQEDELRAAGLGLPGEGAAREGEYKRKTSTAKESRNPDFGGQRLEFRGIRHTTLELAFVRFKVMDDESFGRDDLVGWAAFRLGRLEDGVGLVHVYDDEGLQTEGRLLVRVAKKFTPA